MQRFFGLIMVTFATGVASSSGVAVGAVTESCAPCLKDVSVEIRGRFLESRFVGGSLVVRGRLEDGATILARLRTGLVEHWRYILSGLEPAGAFELTHSVPKDLQPGSYTLEVRAQNSSWTHEPAAGNCARAGGPETTGWDCYALPLTVQPPPEGYVDHAYASRSRSGPPVRRVPASTKQVWVRFEFLPYSLPLSGSRLSVTWQLPRGRQIAGPVLRTRSFAVKSFLRSTRPLVKGSWHVVLRAGGVVAKRVRFEVR